MGLDKRSNWIRVRRVLEDTAAAVKAGGVYDPHAKARDRGRKRIIKYDSEQAKVVLDALHSVQDEFLRTGRRARAAEDQDSARQPSTRKIRQRQRKETLEMPPFHPDLLPAWKKLTQGSGGGEVGCVDLELELELELEAD